MSIEKISIRQVKAARALLAWSQKDLAEKSGVSHPTIARLETDDGSIGGRPATAAAIRTALEAAGIEFIAENGGGAGVRLVREVPVQDRGPWIIYARIRGRRKTYVARRLREKRGIALPDEVSPEMDQQIEATQWIDARERHRLD